MQTEEGRRGGLCIRLDVFRAGSRTWYSRKTRLEAVAAGRQTHGHGSDQMLQGMPENGEVAANKLMAAYQLRLKRGMGNVERGVRKSSSTVRTGNLPRVLPANWTYQAREGERVKGARIPGSYIVWGKAGLRGDLLEVNLKEGVGYCV